MDDKEFAQIYGRAEEELKKYPGVVGVGYGYKEVEGETTEIPAFTVIVWEKKRLDQLAPDEVVPTEFEGVPTDVIKIRRVKSSACEDTAQHSPLIGGMSITNLLPGDEGKAVVGTLGFFATIDGASGPKNVVLVSNQHVLGANSAPSDATIYKPAYKEEGGKMLLDKDEKKHLRIGKIQKPGKKDAHLFTYPSESERGYYVDCAAAKLDISISSWCNSNCGVSYKNEIRDLNVKDSSEIANFARAKMGDKVVKVGRTTSRTEGTITKVLHTVLNEDPEKVQANVMEITVQGVDCDGIARFSFTGDSGAAIVNEAREIIGIQYAHEISDARRSYACHIHPALHFLEVTPISEANPPVRPAGQALSNVKGFLDDGIEETVALRERFVATPRGAKHFDEILRHREEVVELVNRHRPVTVAWHRAQGPAFLAHAAENARHPAHRIPFEIEGVDRATLLSRMADVLTEHGSGALAAALAAHRAEVLALVDLFDDLHELVGRFEDLPVDA
jgi:hypothetical protein